MDSKVMAESRPESSSQANEAYENTPLSQDTDNDLARTNELLSDRYRIIKRLGKGSQGAVFLAEELASNQKVAVKQLIIQSVKDWKQYDLFHREADTLKRLNIPGIAKLYEVREYLDIPDTRAYIIQEYIEGDPLQEFIAKGHRFQISQIGDLLLQLTEIIKKLHNSHPPVIHRDIKPSNILLNYAGDSTSPKVHLIDFGAVANPQVKSGGSTVVGTYGYMAPEQLMGHACPASDIYSLAIVAVYLLSGTPPEELEIQDFNVLIDPHLEHLPHHVTTFLRQMLAPNIENRLTDLNTIREFFTALKNQRFDDIPKLDLASQMPVTYSLRGVHYFLQAGNIELWQELPDPPPRVLTKDLKNFLFHHKKHSFSQNVGKTLPIFAVTLIAAIMLAGSLWGLYYLNAFFSIYIPIISSIILILFAIFFSCYMIIDRDANEALKTLLTEGRKSVATVIRIEYTKLNAVTKSKAMKNYLEAYQPTWTITYSFNPPDDSSPDPIIHTFDTHVLSEDLKQGSLIPILYLIKNDDNGENVLSMPFPIPWIDAPVICQNKE